MEKFEHFTNIKHIDLGDKFKCKLSGTEAAELVNEVNKAIIQKLTGKAGKLDESHIKQVNVLDLVKEWSKENDL